MMQKTIAREVSFEGVGVHSGRNTRVTLKPAETDKGIFFRKVGSDPIFLYDKNLKLECDRGTNLIWGLTPFLGAAPKGGCPLIKIMTVEHFLSAVYMMGIVNLEVAIDGGEIPTLEGNALCFKKILDEAGIVDQDKELEIKKIDGKISLADGDKRIKITPSDSPTESVGEAVTFLEITYTIDYPDTPIGTQTATFMINKENFFNEIAPARTFCLEEEVEVLRSKGLALGGSLDNALVVQKNGYSSELKFPNEPLRHKILDIIGDLATTGKHFCAKIDAVRSGHGLNVRLAGELRKKFYK